MPPRASQSVRLRVGNLASGALLLFAVIFASAPLASHPPVRLAVRLAVGTTYLVNSTADTSDADVGAPACSDIHGKCTLRAAIMQANFHPGADTIKVPAGTYTLTRKGDDDTSVIGDLDVTESVTLKGAGSAKTIINGNGKVTGDRVLQVLATATDTTITGMTIRGGVRSATFDDGGGLLWTGGQGNQLAVRDVLVEDNTSYYGGGVALHYGASDNVRLDHLTVQRNTATAAAGGLEADLGGYGSFALVNSRIVNNHAYEGGGLYLQGPDSPQVATSLRVQGTVIAANHASLSAGFENRSGTPAVPVIMTTSYVHANVATFYGGGIGNYGDLELRRSTLESNTAAKGGALYDYEGGLATLTNDTLSANTATAQGGAVYVEYFIHGLADVVLDNATLSGNASPGGGVYVAAGAQASASNSLFAKGGPGGNCAQPLSGTTNLSDDASCGFGAGDNVTSLKLGPIGAHGGPTRSLVPGVGSAALDSGTNAAAPATDQRGIARPMGAAVDVGAVEVCPDRPAAPKPLKPSATAKGPRLTLTWRAVPCVQAYKVVLRVGSSNGHTVESKTGLLATSLRTYNLLKGRTYYWRVTSVGDRGSATSSWRHVKVT